MQPRIVVVFVALVAAVAAQEPNRGKWTTVDAHAIIDNLRLFTRYKDCIVGKITTGCSQDAIELKRVLDDIVKNGCAGCTPEEAEKGRDTLSYICAKRPEDFKTILAHIDPEGKYRPIFEKKVGPITGGC